MSTEIPKLKDRKWGEKKELGSITKVIEYLDGGEIKQVEVEAHTISSETIMAIEAEHTTIDEDTEEETLDADAYIMDLMCRVFDIEREYLKQIFSNKGSTLRNELIGLMNKTCGFDKEDKEIENQKNSESPQS